jgi:hypothetical protein
MAVIPFFVRASPEPRGLLLAFYKLFASAFDPAEPDQTGARRRLLEGAAGSDASPS